VLPSDASTVWLLDVDGGCLESGDTVFIYTYNGKLIFNKTDHGVRIWQPIEWWQYSIALLDAGDRIFNAKRLNLKNNDWFSLTLVDLDQQTLDQHQSNSLICSSIQN
jgi:hypothetical protein